MKSPLTNLSIDKASNILRGFGIDANAEARRHQAAKKAAGKAVVERNFGNSEVDPFAKSLGPLDENK